MRSVLILLKVIANQSYRVVRCPSVPPQGFETVGHSYKVSLLGTPANLPISIGLVFGVIICFSFFKIKFKNSVYFIFPY